LCYGKGLMTANKRHRELEGSFQEPKRHVEV
jgi:hypothetical protein